ncbi:hypothetical protein HW555_014126 [Spodoptera exigua]|uniref:Uncharacterized protein n=1 Tax=Spodoptera exigua TaxID=7107 RepID=A0A835G1Z6_SPOEX|nr:hypothetical protein HW555_014126 [Spodoptera exigua]
MGSRQWQAAANEMKKYVYAGGEILQGLVNRRNDEASLFLDTNASTTEETKKKEEFLMWVFYQANNNVPVRWFNGEHAYPLAHADERKAINDIYKANTGKDVPVLTHWKDATPYHNRLANVLNRKADF